MSFIQDLITLEIITVTGDLRVKTLKKDTGEGPGADGEEYVIDFKSLFGRKGGKTTVRGDLRVIAATHIEIDRDSLTFIGENLTDQEQDLVAMHMKSVTTALEARSAIVARLLPGRRPGNVDGRLD